MKGVACNPRDRMTQVLWIRVKSNRGIHRTSNAVLGVLIRRRFQLINLWLVAICLKKEFSII